jgi:CRISPR-associated protein (TIGR02584 family)
MTAKNQIDCATKWNDVLLAGIGMSPAVLTETIWALAHRADDPILPHSIQIITTKSGKETLTEALFDNGGWHRLVSALAADGLPVSDRLHFGPASSFFTVLAKPDGSADLDDIVTVEDSEAVANTVMKAVRALTTEPSTRVVASIAGGRKTLSALLTSCISLLGRSQDLLCHVLVSPPFDNPRLDPPFLFPEKGVKHRVPGSKKLVVSARAQVDLTEIPVVKVRGWHEKKYRQLPGDYMTLVRQVQGTAPEAANYPDIIVDMNTAALHVGGTVVRLSAMEFALMLTLVRMLKEEGHFPASWYDCLERMESLKKITDVPFHVKWHEQYLEKDISPDDLRKTASSVRSKVRRTLSNPALADALIPSLKAASQEGYPASRIRIKEFKPKPDVG